MSTFNNQGSLTLRVCENRYVELRAMADGALLRTAMYQDREHVVVPIVTAVGDQVWWPANAETPELVPASVLAAAAQSRNNRPVVMGHPKVSGSYVSANSPEILEQYCYGYMFASTFDNGRIKVEAWLDPTMAERVGPAAVNVIDRLRKGEKIEVSEGNYVVTIKESGTFKGKEYGSRWLSAESDHLATLDVTQTGACSNEMGCGNLTANQSVLSINELNVDGGTGLDSTGKSLHVGALTQARRPTFTGTETVAWSKPSFADYVKYLDNSSTPPTSVGQCSSELKAKIAAHTLLGDPSATTFNALSSLPVVNPATDKLNERALRAILAGRGVSGLTDTALASAQEIARRLLNSEFSANLSTSTSTNGAKMKNKDNFLARILASIKNAVSNNDLRWSLQKALSDIRPGVSFVDDEDIAKKIVRYCVVIRFGDYYSDGELEYHFFQRSFDFDESGNVTLGDDEIEVDHFDEWKPIGDTTITTELPTVVAAECGCHKNNNEHNNQHGDTTMSVTAVQKSLVGKIIASNKSPFEEADRKVLEGMSEEKLQKLADGFVDPIESPAATTSATPEVATPAAPVVSSAAPTTAASTRTLTEDEYRSLRAAADAYEAQQVQRRAYLVSGLKTAQSGFTETDLTAMDMTVLEKLATAFKVDQPAVADYSMRGIPTPTVSRVAEHPLPDTWGLNKTN